MKIGFIGLGGMGQAIALRILQAGHEVTVWNRSSGPATELAREGALAAKQPEETLQGDCLFSMLANDSAIHDIGLDGWLLDSAKPGLVHVNMATISTAFARELTATYRKRDLGYVAAPVFGRPEAAAAGKLVITGAGATKDIDLVRSVLEAVGRRFDVVGAEPAQANLFKIAGNFLLASAIEALGEAAALLRKGGADPEQFMEVMTNTLFAAPAYQIYAKLVVDQKFAPAGFKLRLGYKDAGLTLAAAKELETPLPLGSLVHDRFLEAIAAGWGDKDWSALAGLAALHAGLTDKTK